MAGPLQLSSTSKRSLRAGVSPSSHGFRPLPPLHRRSLQVSTPGRPRAPFGRAVPPARSCSAFAVSHRLDGLLHLGAAGLLHPAAGHEVRRVSVAIRQVHPEVALRVPRLPHDATHTLRRIPLVSSRTASPRPLPSCRYPSPRTPRPGLAGPVHLPPRAETRVGVPRSAEAARGALSSRRGDSLELPLPWRRGARAPARRPPSRRGVRGSRCLVSSGPRPPDSLAPPVPRSTEVGAGRRLRTVCGVVDVGSMLPSPGGCGGTGVPAHPWVCFIALPRLRGREPRDLGRALTPSAKPLAAALSPPAEAGFDLATSRLPAGSGSGDPHTPARHSRAPSRGPAPARGPAARCERPAGPPRCPCRAGLDSARRCAVRCRCGAPASSVSEWPTSRPCSADESVATLHRCRWRIALSFHGLCTPPRSSFARSSRPWRLRGGCGPAPKRSVTHLASGIPPTVALLRSRRTGLGLALRRSLSELGAAVPPPFAPWCPRAPGRSGARRRRPSWGL
jgi:hypothetical protein